VVALQLGNRLIPPDREQRALPLVVGLAILFVLVNVPLLGGIVRALATVVGLGLIVQWLRGRWSARGGV
jgi:hypothetical protein